MTGRVVPLGADIHSRVQAMLPWYARARLGVDDRASVEAHLAECPRCQAELAWERRLHVTDDDDADEGHDVERDLAALRVRIAGVETSARPVGLATRLARGWRQGPGWVRWALAAQGALVVMVAMLSLWGLVDAPSPEQRYRALGAHTVLPAAGGGHLIVRFRPDATEQEMRDALRDSDARLVHGPTTTDAYVLTVPAARVHDAVARLRARRAVLLVESLESAGAP